MGRTNVLLLLGPNDEVLSTALGFLTYVMTKIQDKEMGDI